MTGDVFCMSHAHGKVLLAAAVSMDYVTILSFSFLSFLFCVGNLGVHCSEMSTF